MLTLSSNNGADSMVNTIVRPLSLHFNHGVLDPTFSLFGGRLPSPTLLNLPRFLFHRTISITSPGLIYNPSLGNLASLTQEQIHAYRTVPAKEAY